MLDTIDLRVVTCFTYASTFSFPPSELVFHAASSSSAEDTANALSHGLSKFIAGQNELNH